MDDEFSWRIMLHQHLSEYLSPLLSKEEYCISTVFSTLYRIHGNSCMTCRTLPTECEIFTIASLLKLSGMFQAEVPAQRCVCEGGGLSESQPSLPGERGLDRLPAVLVGVVRVEEGRLALADSTGHVICEVSTSVATLDLIGRPMVLGVWNWIPSVKGGGYIEVDEMMCVCEEGPLRSPSDYQLLLSIATLKHSMSKKSLPSRALHCVFGRVKALSGPTRSCWVVVLEDSLLSHHTHPVLSQEAHLLHLSCLLRLSEVYLFTDLKDKLLNRGSPSEQRVLVTTATTRVLPHTVPEEPALKKFKTGDSQLSGSSISQSNESTQKLVSYTGTITGCVLPEAGVYEMDSVFRLYLTHQSTHNHGRGLREGAVVTLHNVHVLRVDEPGHKHLSGLFTCPLSTLSISQFSKLNTPFSAYESSNVLCSLVKQYNPRVSAWVLDTFISLRTRQLNSQRSYTVLQTLCSTLLPSPTVERRDHLTQFLHHNTLCQLLTESYLPLLPRLSSVEDVLKEVETRRYSNGLHWETGCSEEPGGLYAAAPVRWFYTVVRHAQLTGVQLLVGELRGNVRTGHIELLDNTGRIFVAPSNSSHTHTECVLAGLGANVLISEFDIVVEKTEQENVEKDERLYIVAKKMRVCGNTFKQLTDNKLTIEIVNKNAAHKDPTLSFVALACVITTPKSLHIALNFSEDIFNLYSFINNGCVYELTSSEPLPSLDQLVASPVINITCSMKMVFVNYTDQGCTDIADLMSQCCLPSLPTVTTKQLTRHSFSDKLVSVRGIIESRGHRIDVTSLPTTTSPPPPVLFFKLQSTITPDFITVYCKWPVLNSLPLGLLPGSLISFYSFNLNMSKSGNIYCSNTPSSSLSVHSVNVIDTQRVYGGPSQAMVALPTVLLHDMMQSLLHGCLSKRVVCVRARVVSVLKLCLSYKCRGCQCVLVNGHCMVACLQKRPFLSADGRLVIDDGSGEAHLYAESSLLRQLLQMSVSEWSNVCDLVRTIGTVFYSKPFSKKQQCDNTSLTTDPSPLAQVERILSTVAGNPALQLPVKLYVSPFVSQNELGECILGVKSRAIVAKEVRMSTLTLPRLQLRLLAYTTLSGPHTVSECRSLISDLKNIIY